MVDSILLEIQKFINDPNELTLEIEFEYFRSSLYEGIRVTNELSSNKPTLKIFLVKNQMLGSISFFFRDGPKFQFSLTINEVYLKNDIKLNDFNELKIERFIVLGTEPIGGNQLIITPNSITIYAKINGTNKTLSQYYLLPKSIKNYDYVLDFNILTSPSKPIENPPINPVKKGTEFDSRIIGVGLLILLYIIYNLFNPDKSSPQDSEIQDTEINSVQVDTTQIDTTKSYDPYEFSNESTEKSWSNWDYKNFSYQIPSNLVFKENLSSENKRVYIDDIENIGVSIDIGNINNEQKNTTLKELINNDIHAFALSVNNNNKMNFNDFQLLDYKYGSLGNSESIQIKQESTDISGVKNIKMDIITQFVITYPYYSSITFSYPKASISGREIILKIMDSFKFESKNYNQNKNFEVTSNSENSFSYIVNTDKAYFYSQPNFSYKKSAYLIYGESVTALKEQNGFIYINFENSKGTRTSGWVLKSDLK